MRERETIYLFKFQRSVKSTHMHACIFNALYWPQKRNIDKSSERKTHTTLVLDLFLLNH